jgi:Na+/melibiose symporter-like transporter
MLLARRLPPRPPQQSDWQPDPISLLLFTVFVSATLLALEQVQRLDPQTLPAIGAFFATGMGALFLLIRQENSRRSPLIPLGLLRLPAVWRTDALAACHGAALVSLIAFLPIQLEVVRGHSAAETGLLLLPLTIGIGCGSLLTGRLVSTTGRTTIFPVIGLILVTANLVLLALFSATISMTALAAFLLWNGLFMGTVMGVVQVTVQTASGPRRLGEAAASVQFSRSMGAAFGTALVGSVLFAVLTLKDPEAARYLAAMAQGGGTAALPAGREAAVQMAIAGAFRAAFLVVALFTALGVLLALTIPLRRI